MALVSVLLPVYNAADTIAGAIDSILSQTFSDFEFIIINDASTDNTEEVILSYTDFRIKYYTNSQNQGIVYTLNRGIDLAIGKYIARMDADDIALPTRFEKQVRIMEQDSSIVVCGTGIKTFGSGKISRKIFFPQHSEKLKDLLIRNSCFAHPTVLIRREVLINNHIHYDKEYRHAEDYKLWIELSNYGNFCNISDILLYYRMSDTQITTSHKEEVAKMAQRCRREYIAERFGNKELNDAIINHLIGIHTIKLARRYHNVRLLETLYMSFKHYGILELFYFVFSFDFMRFPFRTQLTIFKRFVFNKKAML